MPEDKPTPPPRRYELLRLFMRFFIKTWPVWLIVFVVVYGLRNPEVLTWIKEMVGIVK